MTPDTARPPEETHLAQAAHPHLHDQWCGHAQVEHGDHLDFLHDGHLHHPDGDHVDDLATRATTLHVPHTCHMHVHGPDCGHTTMAHAGHLDFHHGEHLHAVHDDHYDEH